MGVGGPGQTSRSHCAHFDLEFTRLHVCLSVCKALFWGLEHPLPATLAAAELQHRPPDASASQLTCAFQLLGCLCGSGSPWHGRHGSSEPEEGSLSCHPARFHSGLEIGARRASPGVGGFAAFQELTPEAVCSGLGSWKGQEGGSFYSSGAVPSLVCLCDEERERSEPGLPICLPSRAVLGDLLPTWGWGGCTVGGVPRGV